MIKEIKAHLTKPYTEKQKINFIIENNHNKGYIIEELENGSLQSFEMVKTDKEKAQEKEDLINHLTCTALDLVTFIKSLGLTDTQILEYLQANPSFQLQLTFCKDVYCGVIRQLCPIKITENLILTDEQIVNMFKDKYKL